MAVARPVLPDLRAVSAGLAAPCLDARNGSPALPAPGAALDEQGQQAASGERPNVDSRRVGATGIRLGTDDQPPARRLPRVIASGAGGRLLSRGPAPSGALRRAAGQQKGGPASRIGAGRCGGCPDAIGGNDRQADRRRFAGRRRRLGPAPARGVRQTGHGVGPKAGRIIGPADRRAAIPLGRR